MSMAVNVYSSATQKAHVSQNQMHVKKWSPGVQYYGRGIGLLNIAFDLFYKARKGINAGSNNAHKQEMITALEGCGTDGWGIGVHDLDDAFQHLVKTGGLWTDDNSKLYSGKFQRSLGGPVMEAPAAAANFCASVEKEFQLLTATVTAFNEQSQKVATAADTSNWALIQEGLRSMHANASKAKKVMWLAPAQVKDAAGKAFSFVDILNEIDTTVRNIDKYKQTGLPTRSAAGLEAVRLAVGKIPVLGGFYGEIMGELPDFFLNMKAVFDQRRERILAISRMR